MADIPLRTYVQQLDNLIERKQVDEVIAHCRHILGLYPKHLDTYRMLGKALLEKGRHGDAADIFQRVLSVMPDDFISHVGMSIVREDEANLDSAIWHMERAFESAPANGAIQQELCRLFGRRDGVAPTKARLTRGALARMYAQGGLYLQAEAELKAALAAEADRIDLLTKLAEVYWQTDQPAQAAQTSAAILQKLPYSLEANRILVNVLHAQGRANDAQAYHQRLEAIDPYEAFADPQADGAGAAQVDPAKVMVARLEYVPGMEESGSPDWLASIGAKFEDPAAARAAAAAQPEWLSGANQAPAPTAADYQPSQDSVPDWLKDLDSGPAAISAGQLSEPPDWLKGIDGARPQAAAAAGGDNEGLPDWLTSATGPLPADAVPDWMLRATTEAEAGDATLGTGPLPSSALPDTPPRARPASAVNDATSTAPLPALEPTGEVPDWLKATAASETEEDLPDWLRAITSQPLPPAAGPSAADAPTAPVPVEHATAPLPAEPAMPAPVEPPAPATDAVPDWLENAANTPVAAGPLPDWLKVATGELDPARVAHLLPPEPEAAEPVTEPITPPATAADSAAPVTFESPIAPAVELAASPLPEPDAPAGLSDLPDWLKDFSTTTTAGAGEPPAAAEAPATQPDETPAAVEAEPEPALPGVNIPDWLKNVAPAEAALSAGADDAPDLPDWLQSAAAPTPPPNETPVWLQTAPAGPSLVEAPASDDVPTELPDWLKELSAGAPPAHAQASELDAVGLTGGAQAPGAPVELPDYLQMASPEAIARAEQPLDLEPDEPAPEEEEPAVALPGEIPEWLKAMAPVSPDPLAASPTMGVTETAQAAATAQGESLSWMDELTALVGPVGGAAAASPAPAPAEPPAWLAAPEAQASAEPAPAEPANVVAGGLADDTLTAEIPPWAQNEEPGPSDTIVSWLAGKHVPDWLRQPASDTPTLPAVEWEPGAAEAAASAPAAGSLETAAAPEPVPAPEAPAPAEAAAAGEPDLASMDPEAAFRWLESLAAQQGANRDELFTVPAEPAIGDAPAAEPMLAAPPPEPEAAPVTAPEPTQPVSVPAETVAQVEPIVAAEPPAPTALEEFLKQTEAELPVEPMLDTAPSKKAPAAAEPEPVSAELDTEAALRWLEGLAAQQGAKPEELLTAPEDRTLEAPQWVAAEQAAALTAPETAQPMPVAGEPAPVEAVADQMPEPAPSAAALEAAPAELAAPVEAVAAQAPEPTPSAAMLEHAPVEAVSAETPAEMAAPAEAVQPVPEPLAAETAALESDFFAAAPEAPASDADAEAEAAMRWLEGLAAQQGAKPEELLTAPEERTLETPDWVSAHAAADAAQPAAESSPFESVMPAPAPAVETPPALAAEPEPAAALAEPSAPELPLAEEPQPVAAPAEPAAVVEPPPPEPPAPVEAAPATGAAPDLDKLSRLAERLSAARRAKEAEMEARFAEQRSQQEAARRWVEERLETKRAEAEAEPLVPVPAEPEPVAVALAETPAVPPQPVMPVETMAPAMPVAEVSAPPLPPVPAPIMPAPVMAAPSAAHAETLAAGQAALAGRDYAAAVTHFSTLVEHGHHLNSVVQSLASAADAQQAPSPLLRVLGDAYVRTDQLQKALDTYRQALRRL